MADLKNYVEQKFCNQDKQLEEVLVTLFRNLKKQIEEQFMMELSKRHKQIEKIESHKAILQNHIHEFKRHNIQCQQ